MTPNTKTFLYLLRDLVILYLLFLTILFVLQRNYIYIPNHAPPDRVMAGLPNIQVIGVTTADGLRLSAWYQPPPVPGGLVVILFHGNGGNIATYANKARSLIAGGCGILLAEYRGYGGNPGHPDEKGLYNDARAYMAWLAAQKVPEDRIVLYGLSLGTGVAVKMALEHPKARALILESFTSLAAAAQSEFPYAYIEPLVLDRFDNLLNIGKIHMPVLILHGERDRQVPYSHGKLLYAAANQPKSFESFPLGGHNNLARFGDISRVLDYLHRLPGADPGLR